MAAMKDYYSILNVSRKAMSAEIRKAYRRLAHEWHPDKNPGNETVAEEIFKEIGEAYTVLTDERAKLEYDAGLRDVRPVHGRPADMAFYRELYRTVSADVVKERFMDFVQTRRDMFGKGLPIRILVRVSEQDMLSGTALELRVNRRESCKMCRGTGEIKGASCPDCRGTARKKYESTVAVVIPAGTRHGDVITLTGEGNAGFKGFAAGDLIVRVADDRADVETRTLIR